MALIVQKYGGSSLAASAYIKRVAARLAKLRQEGNQIVVVVSAMGKTTDELVALANEVSAKPDKREMDMLLSVGERISISLLAMALHDLGCEAISYTGSQVGIITDEQHTRARILEVRADRLREQLEAGKVVIVAGFQGVSTKKEITTLGRGGSDTTAVALAAALKADRVELMKDVDGIYKASPEIIENPEINAALSYAEMEEMASLDAGVLKNESISLAAFYGVKIGVGSASSGNVGTIISDNSLTPGAIRGITCDEEVVHVRIKTPLPVALSRHLLSRNQTFFQYLQGRKKISFYTIQAGLEEIRRSLMAFPGTEMKIDDDIAMISIIGAGLLPGSALVNDIFALLSEALSGPYDVSVQNARVTLFTARKASHSVVEKLYAGLIGKKAELHSLNSEG
jgi:aspartate kinase